MHQPSYSPHQLASKAKYRLAEFLLIQLAPWSFPPITRGQWRPPLLGTIKINFDGTIHKSGIGVVLRDAHGLVLASLSQQMLQVYSPLEIEVKATSTTL